jgi:hypothetical protein
MAKSSRKPRTLGGGTTKRGRPLPPRGAKGKFTKAR